MPLDFLKKLHEPSWPSRDALTPSPHLWSFLARTLVSNLRPFLATYSASLSITGWMSGGGGMMAATGASALRRGASGHREAHGTDHTQGAVVADEAGRRRSPHAPQGLSTMANRSHK